MHQDENTDNAKSFLNFFSKLVIKINLPLSLQNEKKHKRSPSQDSYKEKDGALNSQNTVAKISKTPRKRRTRVPEKPNYSINLWSIMKNCIGKELTKIPMPVSQRRAYSEYNIDFVSENRGPA